MKKITYEFADGSKSVVEVTDEFYVEHEKLVQAEKKNHWRNTRRHVSFDILKESQLEELVDAEYDLLAIKITNEEKETLNELLLVLSEQEQILVQKYYFEDIPLWFIADEEDVYLSTLYDRLQKIYKKLELSKKEIK